MLDPNSSKDRLGEGSAVTQKEEVYIKRDAVKNTQQTDYRHRHHPQGKNLNGEGKDSEGQVRIGEEEITAIQISSPLSKPLELVHMLPLIVGGNVSLPKGILKIIPILYWRIPMNPPFPNKGSPPIEGIPLKAKGSQWKFSLFANMMASKELFNLHFPI